MPRDIEVGLNRDFETVAEGLASATSPGDTVWVFPDKVYKETNLGLPEGVRLFGAPGTERPVIDGQFVDNGHVAGVINFWLPGGEVEFLEVINGFWGGISYRSSNANECRVGWCRVKDTNSGDNTGGIWWHRGGNARIHDNYISGSVSNHNPLNGHGLLIFGGAGSGTVIHNRVENCWGKGIHNKHGSQGVARRVVGNHVTRCGNVLLSQSSDGDIAVDGNFLDCQPWTQPWDNKVNVPFAIMGSVDGGGYCKVDGNASYTRNLVVNSAVEYVYPYISSECLRQGFNYTGENAYEMVGLFTKNSWQVDYEDYLLTSEIAYGPRPRGDVEMPVDPQPVPPIIIDLIPDPEPEPTAPVCTLGFAGPEGDTIRHGDVVDISWVGGGDVLNIRLHTGDTARVASIFDGIQNQDSFLWTVPDTIPIGDDYYIVISDPNVANCFVHNNTPLTVAIAEPVVPPEPPIDPEPLTALVDRIVALEAAQDQQQAQLDFQHLLMSQDVDTIQVTLTDLEAQVVLLTSRASAIEAAFYAVNEKIDSLEVKLFTIDEKVVEIVDLNSVVWDNLKE